MTPLKLRPLRRVFRQGLTASIAFLTPVFVALYVLTIPHGPWLVVVITQAAATTVVLLASWLFHRTTIWVEADGLRERGFFGYTHRVPLDDIGSVVLAETFTGVSAESRPQLFVCDHDGKQVLRLRGEFWAEDDMRALAAEVAAAIETPPTILDSTVSKSELLARYPGLLYWFERHPVLAALAFTAATAAFGAVLLGVLRLFGMPIAE